MSGQSTHGLPYPTGTDLVRDGDNAIKALADAVDTFVPIPLDLVASRRNKVAMMMSEFQATFNAQGRTTLNVSATFSAVIWATYVGGAASFPFMCAMTNPDPASLEFFAQYQTGSNVTGTMQVRLLIIGTLR